MGNEIAVKILLVGNYREDGQKSMQAFANLLHEELSARGEEVVLFYPKRVLLPAGTRPVGLWKWVAYIDKYLIAPFQLWAKVRHFDIVHICDHSNAVYRPVLRGKPHSITCHDVIAIQAARGEIRTWHVGRFGRLLQSSILKHLQRFDRIICVSNLTRQDLFVLCGRSEGVTTIHNGLSAPFAKACDEDLVSQLAAHGLQHLQERPYFLHVGSAHARKNRPGVLKIYFEYIRSHASGGSRPRPRLLFVGPPPDDVMREFIARNGLGSDVLFVSDTPHSLLRALYSGAAFFLFPSLNEGFGWPVAEAQACGCPVLTTNRPPMTEVGGDAAVYCDPDAHAEAAAEMHRALHHASAIVQAGYRNAERFSSETMIDKYLDQLRQLATRS